MNAILILISLVLCALRIGGQSAQWFQALAHLQVGGLIAAARVSYLWERWAKAPPACVHKFGAGWRLYANLAVLMTTVELACFLAGVGR